MDARRSGFPAHMELAAAGIGIALCVAACDQPAPPPPDAPPEASSPKKPAPPTTQELLNGPRHTLALGNLPFTADVPAGWAVHAHGEPGRMTLQMLEGPVLGGEAHITLRQRDNVSPERMKSLIDHARRGPLTVGRPGVTVDVRDLSDARTGDGRIIERRVVPTLAKRPGKPASSALATLPSDRDLPGKLSEADWPIEWRITIFTQAGINYEQYELLFIDLSPAVYTANETLLRGVIDSLKPADVTRPPL